MRRLLKKKLIRAEHLKMLALDTLHNQDLTSDERVEIETCMEGLDVEIRTLKFQYRVCRHYKMETPSELGLR